MTERGQRVLKRTVRRSHQLSAESIAKDLQTSCGLQISTTVCKCFMEWVSMAEQLLPSFTKCNAVRYSAVKQATTLL
ncbi:unnamed protein product [Staurois parvus]|uniref:Transposase n=1 Tax=Staurois parvus TaxID=386267 RepID=A0ABN9BI03_9NEOB|nr:unnamed protein product [Staurois parvus]